MGNRKGRTSSPITKLKPRSAVSDNKSARLSGWSLKRSRRILTSWENLTCIDLKLRILGFRTIGLGWRLCYTVIATDSYGVQYAGSRPSTVTALIKL
jgi:hypothetical protein